MRIAAGVLLIIAAVFNLFGSFEYFAKGSLASVGTEYSTELREQIEASNNNTEITEESKQALIEASDAVSTNGPISMAVGVFLLISIGILIAGAVFLFTSQKPTFILIAGAMAILAEILGITFSLSGFGIFNIVGLVAGVLAIICANAMRKSLNPV